MMWVFRRRRALGLACLTTGTVFQVSACTEQASLFALRVAFSSFTLPINQAILAFFDAIASILPQGGFFQI